VELLIDFKLKTSTSKSCFQSKPKVPVPPIQICPTAYHSITSIILIFSGRKIIGEERKRREVPTTNLIKVAL
jgi:hypothetical protein